MTLRRHHGQQIKIEFANSMTAQQFALQIHVIAVYFREHIPYARRNMRFVQGSVLPERRQSGASLACIKACKLFVAVDMIPIRMRIEQRSAEP